MYEEYIDLLDILLDEKDHGIWISTLPLIERVFKCCIADENHREKIYILLPKIISKLKNLCTHFNTDHTVNGVNDPFL